MWLLIITPLCYFLAGVSQLCSSKQFAYIKQWLLGISLIAIGFHGVLLHSWLQVHNGQNLTFLNLLSLLSWLLALLIWVMILKKSLELLAGFIFIMAGLSILSVVFFPEWHISVHYVPQSLFHRVFSILTFCVLFIAGLLALLLALQEKLLRYKHSGSWIEKIPPLETLECLLFQVNSWGFVLLTVVLTTGLYFYQNMLWKNTILIQKTILAVAAWLIFLMLLVGRYWRGWRGRPAIYSTLWGVLLLIVIYFGSEIIFGVFH